MANIAKKPKISLIAAISKGRRALGYKNQLLWKIEGDLPRFKKLTTGHPIIMGRNTYLSIGRPLPNRTNIVLSDTGDKNLPQSEGLIVVDSMEKALEEARKIGSASAKATADKKEIFFIGGGMVYKSSIDLADRLYLTIVDDEPEADVFFPDYSAFTKEISREPHSDHTPPFSYVILER